MPAIHLRFQRYSPLCVTSGPIVGTMTNDPSSRTVLLYHYLVTPLFIYVIRLITPFVNTKAIAIDFTNHSHTGLSQSSEKSREEVLAVCFFSREWIRGSKFLSTKTFIQVDMCVVLPTKTRIDWILPARGISCNKYLGSGDRSIAT